MCKNNRKGLKLYKFLNYVLLAIILIIIAGSVFSLFKKKNTDEVLRSETPSEIRGKKAL